MSRSAWLTILGYGLLTGLVLACIWLISVASIHLPWGRELAGGLIAIIAMVIGLRLAARAPTPSTASPVALDSISAEALDPQAVDVSIAPHSLADPTEPLLSPRERQVLALLAEGQSNKQIARNLLLSENTIKTHLANLYAKLGAAGRTEALAIARRRGLFAVE